MENHKQYKLKSFEGLSNIKEEDFVFAPRIIKTDKSIVVGKGVLIEPGFGFVGNNLKSTTESDNISVSTVGQYSSTGSGDIGFVGNNLDFYTGQNGTPARFRVSPYGDNLVAVDVLSTSVVVGVSGWEQSKIIPRDAVSLTDASANTIFSLTLISGARKGGTIKWECSCTDGTEHQLRTGITTFAAVNKGGVYTTDVDEIGGSIALSAGTLTGTWSILTGTNEISLQFTPTSSLTPTSLTLSYSLEGNSII